MTIATVDLESAGSTTNIVTIDSTTTSDYDGIAALNITGAAGLDLTTDFAVKTEIDASELTGALDLNLVAATDASVDISEYVTGTVTNLTLTDYAFDAAGVVVTSVAPGSPAARAGIERGDLIPEVGQEQVDSVEEVVAQIDGARDRSLKSVVLRVVRSDEDAHYLAVDIEE